MPVMRIRLSPERREVLLRKLHEFYQERFEEELSSFRAEMLLDMMVEELGPPVYNQAIQDARAFMSEKLGDLDAEYYEPETPVDGE